MSKLNQRGDTIVEVLIAVAIAGAVLAGAYTIANKSSQQVRMAQERSEAQKIATGLVERLNGAVVVAPTVGVTNPFCFEKSPSTSIKNFTISAVPALATDTFDSSVYDGQCTRTNGALTYYTIIERNSDPTFTVHVRWSKLGGGTNEEVTLRYRTAQ
jgi:Tfp pilus assembly protein PilV